MMVLFQNKIIYMPSMPPFARRETILDYEAGCRPVGWREERIRSGDGVEVAVAVGEVETEGREGVGMEGRGENNVVVVYFQGYVRVLRLYCGRSMYTVIANIADWIAMARRCRLAYQASRWSLRACTPLRPQAMLLFTRS